MKKFLFRFDYSLLDSRDDIQFHKIFITELKVEKALEIFRRDCPAASILQISQDPTPVIVS